MPRVSLCYRSSYAHRIQNGNKYLPDHLFPAFFFLQPRNYRRPTRPRADQGRANSARRATSTCKNEIKEGAGADAVNNGTTWTTRYLINYEGLTQKRRTMNEILKVPYVEDAAQLIYIYTTHTLY